MSRAAEGSYTVWGALWYLSGILKFLGNWVGIHMVGKLRKWGIGTVINKYRSQKHEWLRDC